MASTDSSGLPSAPDQRLEAIIDLLWAGFSSSTFTVFVKLRVVR